MIPRAARPLALLVLAALSAGLSGCQLFYENSYRGSNYTLHSDHDAAFLQSASGLIDRIQSEYVRVFSTESRELPRMTFVFKGTPDDLHTFDLSTAPDLLGYYLPVLHLIAVDTRHFWTREREMLSQILLHEMSHHFLISRVPTANDHCWLNEGLAGNLEMSVFDDDGFEVLLLNPQLLRLSQRILVSRDTRGIAAELVDMGWAEFHREGAKQDRYALAWSLVYHLLTTEVQQDGPLSKRIDGLLALDRDAVVACERRWIEHVLSLDLTDELVNVACGAESPPLARRWALEQLGKTGGLSLDAAAACLTEAMARPDATERAVALESFVRLAARVRRDTPEDAARVEPSLAAGRDAVARLLRDEGEPIALRRRAAEEAAHSAPRDPLWIDVFIDLLSDADAELRVTAAQGLARAGVKPTVLNPAFWRAAEATAREAETEEWHAWRAAMASATP